MKTERYDISVSSGSSSYGGKTWALSRESYLTHGNKTQCVGQEEFFSRDVITENGTNLENIIQIRQQKVWLKWLLWIEHPPINFLKLDLRGQTSLCSWGNFRSKTLLKPLIFFLYQLCVDWFRIQSSSGTSGAGGGAEQGRIGCSLTGMWGLSIRAVNYLLKIHFM